MCVCIYSVHNILRVVSKRRFISDATNNNSSVYHNFHIFGTKTYVFFSCIYIINDVLSSNFLVQQFNRYHLIFI